MSKNMELEFVLSITIEDYEGGEHSVDSKTLHSLDEVHVIGAFLDDAFEEVGWDVELLIPCSMGKYATTIRIDLSHLADEDLLMFNIIEAVLLERTKQEGYMRRWSQEPTLSEYGKRQHTDGVRHQLAALDKWLAVFAVPQGE